MSEGNISTWDIGGIVGGAVVLIGALGKGLAWLFGTSFGVERKWGHG